MVLFERMKAKKIQGRAQDRPALLYCHRAPIVLCQNKEHAMIPHSNGTHPTRQRGTATRGNSQRQNPLETEDSRTLMFPTTDAIAASSTASIFRSLFSSNLIATLSHQKTPHNTLPFSPALFDTFDLQPT